MDLAHPSRADEPDPEFPHQTPPINFGWREMLAAGAVGRKMAAAQSALQPADIQSEHWLEVLARSRLERFAISLPQAKKHTLFQIVTLRGRYSNGIALMAEYSF
jgi:hypothetical protein